MIDPLISYAFGKKYTDQEVTRIVNRETDSDAMSRQAAVDANDVDKVNLKIRLDDDYNEISDKIGILQNDVADHDAQIASLASGSPKGVYTTTTDLQNAFPTGNTNIYLVTGNVKEAASLAITAEPTASGNVTVTLDGVAKTIAVTIGTAEVASLTISAVPTASGNVTVTLNGVSTNITVDPATDTTTDAVATKIRNTVFTGWTTGGTGSTVTFTATIVGVKTDATYSAGSTGTTGTMSTTTQGVDADTATTVATKIRGTSFSGWTTSGTGTTVTFTAISAGAKTDSAYSAGTTGATGTMNTTTQGVNADGNWYYWNGSAWTAGGVYQSAGLADKSVKINHADFPFLTVYKNLAYQTDAYLTPVCNSASSTFIANMTNYVTYPAGQYLVFAEFNLSATNLVNANFLPMLFDGGTVYNSGVTSTTPAYALLEDKTHIVTYGIVTLSTTKTCRAGVNVTNMNTNITNSFTITPSKVYVIALSAIDDDLIEALKFYTSVFQDTPVIKLPDVTTLKADFAEYENTLITIDKTNFPFVTLFENKGYHDPSTYLNPSVSTSSATILNNLTPYTTLEAGKYLVYLDVDVNRTILPNGRLVPSAFDGTTVVQADLTTAETPRIGLLKNLAGIKAYGIITIPANGNYRLGFNMTEQTTSVTNTYTVTTNKVYAIPMDTIDNDVVASLGFYSLSKTVPVITLPKIENEITGIEQIICYGDSMTGSSTGWVYTLENTYGVNVLNRGIGGQTAGQIATRQGGLPLIIDPFTIPADTSQVAVTLNTTLYAQQSSFEGINPVYINGIKGTLYNSTNTSGGFTFARSVAGTAVSATRPTVVFTDNMQTYRKHPMVIWVGTNGDYSTSSRTSDNLIEIIERMLSYGECQRYVVIGLTTDTNLGIPEINTALAKKFGRRFLDLRSYLINYGLSDMGITPTTDDNNRFAANNVPSSLLSDTTHLTTACQQQVVAPLVYKKLQELYMV